MNLTIIPSIGNCPELNTGLRRGRGGGLVEWWRGGTLRSDTREETSLKAQKLPLLITVATLDHTHSNTHIHTHTPACGLRRVWRATGLNHCFCQEQFILYFSHTARGHRCRHCSLQYHRGNYGNILYHHLCSLEKILFDKAVPERNLQGFCHSQQYWFCSPSIVQWGNHIPLHVSFFIMLSFKKVKKNYILKMTKST